MREIKEIIVHCSATFPDQRVTVADITRWHRANGWKSCGYHYVIDLDGTIEDGRSIEEEGAHCLGHNANSIGICYVGGLSYTGEPTDTRNEAQKAAMVSLFKELKRRFPAASIHGHNEFSKKACPCFNVQAWCKEVGV